MIPHSTSLRLALLLLLAIAGAWPERSSADVTLIVWGRPGMRDDVIRLVAESAKPSPPALLAKGDSLRQAIIEKCGRVDLEYRKIVFERNPDIAGRIDTRDQWLRTTEEVEIVLPACLYAAVPGPTYVVKEAEKLENIAQEFMGFGGELTIAQIVRVNRLVDPGQIKPGLRLRLPYLAKPTPLIFPDSTAQARFEARRLQLDLPSQTAMMTTPQSPVANNLGLCPHHPVKFEVACNDQISPYPFDQAEVARVLSLVDWIHNRRSRPDVSTIVVTIDTGIDGFASTDFTFETGYPETFDKRDFNKFELNQNPSRTIGLTLDDTLGADLFRPSPIKGAYLWEHGTHVAGLIASNMQDAQLRAYTKGRVTLSAYNAVGNDKSYPLCQQAKLFSLKPGLVEQAISKANALSPLQVKVINLSLWSQTPVEWPNPNPANVFVISAGNKKVDLDNQQQLYPANFGSKNLRNVIVVGAHDSKNNLVDVTAFGKSTVDLAAPGCRIRSFVGPKLTNIDAYSGTSQAAAFVSFTAALVNSLYPKDKEAADVAQGIRNRILLTVDQVPQLKDKVRSGGKLNIAKAIAAEIDVLEKVAGTSTQLLYGVIGPLSEKLAFCATDSGIPWSRGLNEIGRVDLQHDGTGSAKITVVSPDHREILPERSCTIGNEAIEFSEFEAPGKLGPRRQVPVRDLVRIYPAADAEERRWKRRCIPVTGNEPPGPECP